MDILEIQKRLKELGFDPGPLDGDMGEKTRAAIIAFQKHRGLKADGVVGPKTLAALAPELSATEALLTETIIRKVAPKARPDIVAGLVSGKAALEAAGLVTKPRLAHFLAQICTETGGLRLLEENLNYTAKRLTQVFPKRFPTLEAAKPFANNPEKLANKGYGGRLGNNKNGDGFRYRGGGLIQTTGRSNYEAAGFADRPEDLRKMPGALDAALVFWMTKGCNTFADKNDIVGLRKRVNGGKIGLEEARAFHAKAVKALGL